jgi:hypothetical protein
MSSIKYERVIIDLDILMKRSSEFAGRGALRRQKREVNERVVRATRQLLMTRSVSPIAEKLYYRSKFKAVLPISHLGSAWL